jgi:hypothetical protein
MARKRYKPEEIVAKLRSRNVNRILPYGALTIACAGRL